MAQSNLNWTVFCSPSNEYSQTKAMWADTLCQWIGGSSYSAAADAPVWLQFIASGVWTMLWTAVVAFILAFVLGSFLGVIRTLPNRFGQFIGNAYVELFRNIPLIVQLFFWAFVFPEFLPESISAGSGEVVSGGWWKNILNHHPAIIGVLALALYTSARISEHVRAGIETVTTGQKNAAKSMGFSTFQTYIYVVLPIAYRIIWPVITSESMNIFKNSAVLYVLSVMNLFIYSKTMTELTSQDIVILVLTTPIYVIITYSIKLIMVRFEKRIAVPGLGTGER